MEPEHFIMPKIPATFRKGEDGHVTAECPSLPGCISQGPDTLSTLVNLQEAAEVTIESIGAELRAETGRADANYTALEELRGEHAQLLELFKLVRAERDELAVTVKRGAR